MFESTNGPTLKELRDDKKKQKRARTHTAGNNDKRKKRKWKWTKRKKKQNRNILTKFHSIAKIGSVRKQTNIYAI